MASRWTCARCASQNDEAAVSCRTCGVIRGGVITEPNAVTPPTAPKVSAPAPWKPSRRKVIVDDILYNFGGGRLALLAVLMVIGAVVVFSQVSRDASGTIDKPGDLQAIDLRLGDCYDVPSNSGDSFENAHGVPCDQPHHLEVFYKGLMPNTTMTPTDEAIKEWAGTYCQPAFEAYVGTPIGGSALAVSVFYPAQKSWDNGERLAQCSLSNRDGALLYGSMKGSGR